MMSVFFQVIIVVVWLLVIVGLGFVSLEHFFFAGNRLIGTASGLAAILLFAGGVALVENADHRENSCLEAGMAWAITGHHTELQYKPGAEDGAADDGH